MYLLTFSHKPMYVHLFTGTIIASQFPFHTLRSHKLILTYVYRIYCIYTLYNKSIEYGLSKHFS